MPGTWRDELHPRDWRGRFITKGARVRLQGGLYGTVTDIRAPERPGAPSMVTVKTTDGRVGSIPNDRITIAEAPMGMKFISDGSLVTIGNKVGRTDKPGEWYVSELKPDTGAISLRRSGAPYTEASEDVDPESVTRRPGEQYMGDGGTTNEYMRQTDAGTADPGDAAGQAIHDERAKVNAQLEEMGREDDMVSGYTVDDLVRSGRTYLTRDLREDPNQDPMYVGIPSAGGVNVSQALVRDILNLPQPGRSSRPNAPDPALQRPSESGLPAAPSEGPQPEGVRSRYDLRAIRERANPQEQRDLVRVDRERDAAGRAVSNASYRRSSGGSRVQSPAEVRANQRVRNAEVEVQRVENAIYDRLVREQTGDTNAPPAATPSAPAAPTPEPSAPAAETPSVDRFSPDTPQWVKDAAALDPAKMRRTVAFRNGETRYTIGDNVYGNRISAILVDPTAYGQGVVVYRDTDERYNRINLQDFHRSVSQGRRPSGGTRLQARPVVPQSQVGTVLSQAGIHPATSSSSSVRGFRRTTSGYRTSRNDNGTISVDYDSGMGVAARQAEVTGRANEQRQKMVDALREAGYEVSVGGSSDRIGSITITGRTAGPGRTATRQTPAAPTPAAPPISDVPRTGQDTTIPTGPTAADGLPLVAGDRITVNGRSGTIRSVRPGTGVAIYEDADGRQRSAQIARFMHADPESPQGDTETPAPSAPSTPEVAPTPAPIPEAPVAPEVPATPEVPNTGDAEPGDDPSDPDFMRKPRATVSGLNEAQRSEVAILFRDGFDGTNDDEFFGGYTSNDYRTLYVHDKQKALETLDDAIEAAESNYGPDSHLARDAQRMYRARARTLQTIRTKVERVTVPSSSDGDPADAPAAPQPSAPTRPTPASPDAPASPAPAPSGVDAPTPAAQPTGDAPGARPADAPAVAPDTPAAPATPAATPGPDNRYLLEVGDEISVNGRTGTIRSIRDSYNIAIFTDQDGRQRSAQLARVTSPTRDARLTASPNTPAPTAPAPPVPEVPAEPAGRTLPGLPAGALPRIETVVVRNDGTATADIAMPDGTVRRGVLGQRNAQGNRTWTLLPEGAADPDPAANMGGAPRSSDPADYAQWGDRAQSIAASVGPDVFNAHQRLQAAANRRGAEVEFAQAVEKMYNGENGLGKNGARVKITGVSTGTRTLRFVGNVQDSNGRVIGNIQRVIKYNRDGTPEEIHNDYMSLYSNVQGQGIASDLYRRQEDWAIKQGVPKITILANIDVGGFAWGRKGYDYEDQDTAVAHIATVYARMTRRYGEDYPASKQLLKWVQLMQADQAANTSYSTKAPIPDGWPTPYEVGMVGYTSGARTWPGKEMMLGTHWDATKDLVRPSDRNSATVRPTIWTESPAPPAAPATRTSAPATRPPARRRLPRVPSSLR